MLRNIDFFKDAKIWPFLQRFVTFLSQKYEWAAIPHTINAIVKGGL